MIFIENITKISSQLSMKSNLVILRLAKLEFIPFFAPNIRITTITAATKRRRIQRKGVPAMIRLVEAFDAHA
jgi:hypothetical protein